MTLAVFMGGLALGSAVFGRKADRVRDPLLLYIALEAGVGLCGLAYPFLFEPIRQRLPSCQYKEGNGLRWFVVGFRRNGALDILVAPIWSSFSYPLVPALWRA
jgi:hypothetical protein